EEHECYLSAGAEGCPGGPTLNHGRNERGGGRADPFIRKQLFYVPANPWIEELLHFAAVVRRKTEPLITAEDGTRTLATVLAIARSAETGRPGALSDMHS